GAWEEEGCPWEGGHASCPWEDAYAVNPWVGGCAGSLCAQAVSDDSGGRGLYRQGNRRPRVFGIRPGSVFSAPESIHGGHPARRKRSNCNGSPNRESAPAESREWLRAVPASFPRCRTKGNSANRRNPVPAPHFPRAGSAIVPDR